MLFGWKTLKRSLQETGKNNPGVLVETSEDNGGLFSNTKQLDTDLSINQRQSRYYHNGTLRLCGDWHHIMVLSTSVSFRVNCSENIRKYESWVQFY